MSNGAPAFTEEFDFMALLEGRDPVVARLVAEDARREAEAEARKCRRCDGSGRIGHYHYNQNGLCFGCNGTGTRVRKGRFDGDTAV